MTDEEKLAIVRTIVREELSSIKTDINDHKQTHDELEALVEKRFAELKQMYPGANWDFGPDFGFYMPSP